ncbi:hypothetical protein [Rubrivivax gelatinosus]|uniref:Uncharacterized protein n=1 Tax=Rubrivivax gelatinosus TaxID=28068 RepID=A0A4R2M8F6_RUBGE|nr:hypothetical protein [Rubrivivax gelatinosus]MBK1687215.1 hypothetical protein [Rubrivivax gelatinosus]TCP02620.1 hypothetical protein EV684_106182 [Rubrivivax gelatinosus]
MSQATGTPAGWHALARLSIAACASAGAGAQGLVDRLAIQDCFERWGGADDEARLEIVRARKDDDGRWRFSRFVIGMDHDAGRRPDVR